MTNMLQIVKQESFMRIKLYCRIVENDKLLNHHEKTIRDISVKIQRGCQKTTNNAIRKSTNKKGSGGEKIRKIETTRETNTPFDRKS